MWARGYFCATVGTVDEGTIKKYIEDQKWDDDGGEGCEHLTETDPDGSASVPEFVTGTDHVETSIRFPYRKWVSEENISLEVSHDLKVWESFSPITVSRVANDDAPLFDWLIYEIGSGEAIDRRFFRLQIMSS